jgi:CheY-like chemotaxis protein/HPt (histidine-containing phosphotransfer) domain-containing protein
MMGGEIGVESAEGAGSEFWFTARFDKRKAGTVPEQTAVRRNAGGEWFWAGKREARVLVAEDNVTNQQVALGILKKLGVRADVVVDGAEALKRLETVPYDLVLMDVQMPVMGGLEAATRIRESRSSFANPRIPVVALTAHAMQGDRERFLAAGMDDYLPKPVTPGSLVDILERWIPGEVGFAAPLSCFDQAGLMGRLMGDEELARKVVGGFLGDIPRQVEILRGYLDSGDNPNAERQAHGIKGACVNVGGEAMSAVALEMEKAAAACDLDAARACLPRLKAEFDRLRRAMSERN